MANLTLAIPEDLKKEMEEFKEMNWSEIARAAIKKRIILLKGMDKLLKKSELTEEDSIMLGRKVNKAVTNRYKK